MDTIELKINGKICKVGCNDGKISSDMTLLDYLRNVKNLKGTKYMCRQGGCGFCMVAAVKSPGGETMAVNSCLVPVASCQGWEITTIEKVGNKFDGYHPIQTAIAKHFGTQCGYCSPGWVVSMYCLLQNRKDLTMMEIEKLFSGNICRCTGYRPILDALKTFAIDGPEADQMPDIEDLNICAEKCPKTSCQGDCLEKDWCFVSEKDLESVSIKMTLQDGKQWYSVRSVEGLYELWNSSSFADTPYTLVCGNTSQGLYPREYSTAIIDITLMDDLKGHNIDQNLEVGASTTLAEFITILEDISETQSFSYLKKMALHVAKIANVSVRNQGSLAGNLMIKYEHNGFQSDIFLLLETVGAVLTIATGARTTEIATMRDFLAMDMHKKVILNIKLPPLVNELFESFKIMRRSQSALAIVNAGFYFKMNNNIVEEARIVYGGLSPSFIRAFKSENHLKNQELFTNNTLQGTINILREELLVTENPPEPSAEYRKKLALALFYKAMLSLCPDDKIDETYRSGAVNLNDVRPVSKGTQTYSIDENVWPITQPIQKVEAMLQCSGQAAYTEDLPTLTDEVFAVFVLADVCTGKIEHFDPSEALEQCGTIRFLTAKDIPGLNSFTPSEALLYSANEELLCSGIVKYRYQPVGIMVAETRAIAENAAKMVKITYAPGKEPVIDIKVAKKDANRITQYLDAEATDRGEDVTKVIKGSNTVYWQHHLTPETLVAVTEPWEGGLKIHAATQWTDGIQVMASRALNLDANRIKVYVNCVGGTYGLKISRSIQQAVACGLVSVTLNRPCRFIQSISTNMKSVGKRFPCSSDYEVGVNDQGVIQFLNCDFYEDNGYMINETLSLLGMDSYNNCYEKSRWKFNGFNAITDTAKNTWFRSPGSLENIANAELIMEHIAYAQNLDPISVRLANIDKNYNVLNKMIEDMKISADYSNRRNYVNNYNKINKFKKRGLRFSTMRWTPVGGQNLHVTASVYHQDGTVAITHGGVELGQGMNTKAVQACAYHLKIPVEKIKIYGNNTMIAPNCFLTGGSLTTQNVMLGIRRCCDQLKARLEPFKEGQGDISWENLVKSAHAANVSLQANSHVQLTEYVAYHVCGVALTEVELDTLTGQYEIIRVDIIQDAGRSVNPGIDVGQVEGAFIMGVGYWAYEEICYDKATGSILTDSTHHYTVPLCRDIPQNFVVTLLKDSFSSELIMGSKAIGEPGICLSVGVLLALWEAIISARSESKSNDHQDTVDSWIPIDGPCTVEKSCLLSDVNPAEFVFKP